MRFCIARVFRSVNVKRFGMCQPSMRNRQIIGVDDFAV